MLRKMKRSLAAATLVLAALASASSFAAAPAVLDQVPADAAVVIVVKDLKAFTTNLSNTATRMNIPGVPADLLGTMTAKLGITKGLDVNGSAAFVLLMSPEPKEGETLPAYQKPMVLLLPTTDPKSLLESFKPAAPEDGISEVTMPDDNGEPGYVATAGKFVIFSQDKDFLAFYLKDKAALPPKLSPEAVKSFESNDLVVYANIPQFAPKVIQQMDAMEPMIKMAAGGAPNMTDAQRAVQAASMDAVFSGVRQVLTDGQAALLTLRMNDAGATLGFSGHFKTDSDIGKSIAATNPLPSIALDGLPAGDFLLAGTANVDPKTLSNFITTMYSPYLDPKVTPEDKMPDVKKSIDLSQQMVSLITGGKFALYQAVGDQKGVVHAVALLNVTDAPKYKSLNDEFMKENLVSAMSNGSQLAINSVVAPAPVNAGGAEFTKTTWTFAADPAHIDDPAVKTATEALNKIYGGDHVDYDAAAIGSDRVLFTVNADNALLTAAGTAAKAKTEALSKLPEVAATTPEILPNPTAVIYLPADRVITLIKQEMGGTGTAPAGAIAIGDKPSPIVFSTGVSGSNATAEVHLPISALAEISQFIQDTEHAQSSGPDAPVVPAPQN